MHEGFESAIVSNGGSNKVALGHVQILKHLLLQHLADELHDSFWKLWLLLR